jgi:hypothetical protein
MLVEGSPSPRLDSAPVWQNCIIENYFVRNVDVIIPCQFAEKCIDSQSEHWIDSGAQKATTDDGPAASLLKRFSRDR